MPIEKQAIAAAPSYTPPEGTVEDPRAIIARAPMGRVQLVAVALCIALTALNGFGQFRDRRGLEGVAEFDPAYLYLERLSS